MYRSGVPRSNYCLQGRSFEVADVAAAATLLTSEMMFVMTSGINGRQGDTTGNDVQWDGSTSAAHIMLICCCRAGADAGPTGCHRTSCPPFRVNRRLLTWNRDRGRPINELQKARLVGRCHAYTPSARNDRHRGLPADGC